ncbi:DUF948 domain-containing protein [Desulfobacterium sp. N47]|uniref:DUF948 domain-containing protein n=1 Tax=uncultured Desulfobacterium sp. TaxID=201089 RepID=E1YM81_9BACT|nr:hypothetical protein N47_E47260 [uncultured Desulfobacterium sp.]
MIEHQLTPILSIGLFVACILLFIVVFFMIYTIIQIKKASVALADFLAATDLKINPLIKETEETLKSIRTVSDDIGLATSNIKNISGTLSDLSNKVNALGLLAESLSDQLSIRASGVKAGITAALNVLFDKRKKGGS